MLRMLQTSFILYSYLRVDTHFHTFISLTLRGATWTFKILSQNLVTKTWTAFSGLSCMHGVSRQSCMYGVSRHSCMHGVSRHSCMHGVSRHSCMYGVSRHSCMYGVSRHSCMYGVSRHSCMHGVSRHSCMYGVSRHSCMHGVSRHSCMHGVSRQFSSISQPSGTVFTGSEHNLIYILCSLTLSQLTPVYPSCSVMLKMPNIQVQMPAI